MKRLDRQYDSMYIVYYVIFTRTVKYEHEGIKSHPRTSWISKRDIARKSYQEQIRYDFIFTEPMSHIQHNEVKTS
jgi:hypothetical protein